ncbi:YbfA family protein [Musicola keenii]|uniref:YbfA family protein n=1 Tax=Musicola keenii TaxID=2884250 RepID=UPI00177ED8AE|nr:YbfA family protein [Musicola keenii]
MAFGSVYPLYRVVLRRVAVIVIGVLALPCMLFWRDRARFYSYLHRVWLKTSDKPVWLAQSERAVNELY